MDNLEHLLLRDTAHLRHRHGELGGLLIPTVLDSRRQRLGVGSIRSVEQVSRHRVLGLLFRAGLDVLLFLRLDALPHLDLLLVALLLVQLGPQAAKVLSILGALVAFTRGLLATPFIVVEPDKDGRGISISAENFLFFLPFFPLFFFFFSWDVGNGGCQAYRLP